MITNARQDFFSIRQFLQNDGFAKSKSLLFLEGDTATIKPATKHCNDVILSYAKNLAFSCCYEILHSSSG